MGSMSESINGSNLADPEAVFVNPQFFVGVAEMQSCGIEYVLLFIINA